MNTSEQNITTSSSCYSPVLCSFFVTFYESTACTSFSVNPPPLALLQSSSQEIYDLFFFGWSPFCFRRIELLSLPSKLKQVSSWHWHGGKSHLHSAITEMWSEAGDTLELLSVSTFELRSQATFSALATAVSHVVWHDCAESYHARIKKRVTSGFSYLSPASLFLFELSPSPSQPICRLSRLLSSLWKQENQG